MALNEYWVVVINDGEGKEYKITVTNASGFAAAEAAARRLLAEREAPKPYIFATAKKGLLTPTDSPLRS